jgi:copper chaperone CopZ
MSSVAVVMNALRLLRFKPIQIPVDEPIYTQFAVVPENTLIKTDNIMLVKNLKIKGMSCGHCSARVEKVLSAIDGVEAKVDLTTNSATLHLSHPISDAEIKTAVDNIGYEVTEIN